MKQNQKGFTLIELLVVIAIIGLLSTLSIVALNSARAKSRDARRMADIANIRNALEMYYSDNNAYPASPTVVQGGSIVGSSTYMAIIPSAPTPFDNNTGAACTTANNTYTYTGTVLNGVTNGSYTLTYCLGGKTGTAKAGVNTSTPSGIISQ